MSQEPQKRRRTEGFTLVELMVVVSIIAILATIVGVNVIRHYERANQAAAQAQIASLKSAVLSYKLERKKFPDTLELLVANDKNVKYLDAAAVPKDPWGADYIYEKQGSGFTIKTYGADGNLGGDGENTDICSDSLNKVESQ